MIRPLPILGLLLATGLLSAQAFAQDPASVDGAGYDPAQVDEMSVYSVPQGGGMSGGDASLGGLGIPTQFLLGGSSGGQMNGVEAVESLLKQVSDQMGAPRSSDPLESFAAVQKLKLDAEQLVREHWRELSPRTRDQYRRVFNQDAPGPTSADSLTQLIYQTADGNVAESGLMNGSREAYQLTQNLEDLLLPMLQDLKRNFDAGLERAIRN